MTFAHIDPQSAEIDFLVDRLGDALFTVDLNLNLSQYNQSFKAIAGLSDDFESFTPLDNVLPSLSKSIEGSKPILFGLGLTVRNIEVTPRRPAEDTFDRSWLVSFFARKDTDGSVVGVLGAIVDVTETKRRDVELQKASSLLDRVEEVAHLGYWELDIATGTFGASKMARDIYGLYEDRIPLSRVRKTALEADRVRLKDALKALVEHDTPYDLEYQIRRTSDGAIVDLRTTAAYHKDEHKIIGVVRDITQSNIAAATLKKLSQAVEQNPASIFMTDPSGSIEYVNPRFSAVTGYSFDEIMGKNPRILKSGRTSKETYDDLWRTVSSGKVWRGTFCNKKKNGELYWESASISPIYNRDGVLTNYVAVKEDITELINVNSRLTALNDKAVKRLQYLQAVHSFESEIRKAAGMNELLPLLVSQFALSTDMDGSTLWHRSTDSDEFVPVSAHMPEEWKNANLLIDVRTKLVQSAADECSTLFYNGDACVALGLGPFVKSYGILPLHTNGGLKWLLEFGTTSAILVSESWQNCIAAIGAVSVLALQNAELIETVRNAHAEVVSAYDATLEGWSHALDLRDRETVNATKLAIEVGLSDEQLVHVRRGALLHDVGKLGVPDSILGKPGSLTEEEWAIMKMHPVYANEWLSKVSYLAEALHIPRDHHERWDGTGYPKGIAGDAIPVEARLFTIVDVWDALTNNRPYRRAWTIEAAREYMLEQSGKIFDPRLLRRFIDMLDTGKID
jgi:PAS domain S-box-containing protein